MIRKSHYCSTFFYMLLLIVFTVSNPAVAKNFIVVIDAGHGGHDSGALGKITKEKTINLKVALSLGKKIERNFSDVKVVYTRKKDIFIPLNKRATIANRANADLFISIHTNAVKRGRVYGAETFTLGLSRTKANFEVAKRENSVIEIEENYKQTYAGFNPSSAESYIMFEFIQDKHMKESVEFARLIQKQFKIYARRNDKGVHQAGFLVLRKTSMPSVLVELGFITTPKEERFLHSSRGVEKMAESLFRAFRKYKKEQYKIKNTSRPKVTIKKTSTSFSTDRPIFKVQVLTSSKRLSKKDRRLHGHKEATYYREKGMYKYTIGASTDYNLINKLRSKLARSFKGAFLVAFDKYGTKINIHKAIKQFKNKK